MKPETADRLALPVLTGAYVLSQFYRSYVAVIATQLIDDFGFTPHLFGVFAGAFYFTFAVAQLPLGVAFDRFGVRVPMALCLVVGSLGALALPITHSVEIAVLSQVALGIGCAPLYMGLLNHVMRTCRGDQQVRIVALASAIGYMGAIAAGLPLAWGATTVGWRASLGLVGALMVVATVAVAITLRAAGQHGPSVAATAPGPATARKTLAAHLAFAALLPVCFALVAGGTFRMSWGGPYLADVFQWSVMDRGHAFTAASVVALFWALALARVLRYLSVKCMVLLAFAVGVCAALILALLPAHNGLLSAALICVLFCVGSVHPLIMSQARTVVPMQRLGLWLGVLNSMVFLGVAFSNNSFGWIAERARAAGLSQEGMYSRLFLFTAALLALGWICALFTPRVQRAGRSDPASSSRGGRRMGATG